MRKDLYIIGAGGFGREVLLIAREIEPHQAEWRIKGFLNSERYMDALDGIDTGGYTICESIEEHEVTDNNVYVIAIVDVNAKEKLCSDFISRGAQFINLIHPTAYVANTAIVGKGLILAMYSTISANTEVGDFVTLNAHVQIGHDVVIGDYCTIGPRSSVLGHGILQHKVTLGGGVIIHPHIKVGENATVGIGSVVISKVKAGTAVFGNPATRI